MGERWRGEAEGELPGPAPPSARCSRAAPARPAFLRRVTSALRSHYPDYPDYPAPADGSGTGTGVRRHRPDAGHRFPREPDRAGAVSPCAPESEGRKGRGGGRRQRSCLRAIPRLLETCGMGCRGVCGMGGRPTPLGFRPACAAFCCGPP